MCGIAGIVRFDRPATASRDQLAAMQARLRHRGPDGAGEAFASFAALAHTRLAMVDPLGGAQPLRSVDGRYTLVYNGELYNDAALRRELDTPRRTQCDAETVLLAWERWGERCVDRLDGMFAFFVWDEREQVGWGIRDPLGVKPFAYRTDLGFAFASEAKALLPLHAGAPRARLSAIVEYLVAPAFSGVAASPFADIDYLPPGHVLRIDREGIALRRYWRWSPGETGVFHLGAIATDLRDALGDAVRASATADAPVGVLLSGGLDSTAVAALAGAPLQALTIVFDEQSRWASDASVLVKSDDTPFARLAAREFGLPLEEVRFDRGAVRRELVGLAQVDDALPAWEQEFSQRALARAAAQAGLAGVLVGDAADETHYGYHFLLDDIATSGPRAILARLGSVPVRREIDPDPLTRLDAEYRALVHDADERFPGVEATTRLIVERWLPRLLHNGDVHGMAFGIEPRVPFASRRVLELAQAIPAARALDGAEKAVLREALRGVVPEAIRTRTKSALPKDQTLGEWYRRETTQMLASLHPLVMAVVDLDGLAPLLSRRALPEPERAQLFRVLCLHHWATAYEVQAP